MTGADGHEDGDALDSLAALDPVDTIVAVATPPGRGGIGIVRLSGPGALAIAAPLLRLRRPLDAGRARFASIVDTASGDVLDEAVATYFEGPHSYTGEDVVEIAGHGAPVLMEYLLRACCAGGARLARAGEFTERAFLAGRIDLTQAEAVADLIDAGTLEQARVAARQMGGAVSRALRPAKEQLMLLIAGLEAGIDFAEDDIDLMATAVIRGQIGEIAGVLRAMARSFAYGRVLREGFRLALVGRPNAGKSSLFNRLLDRERAIVTAQPGTTRDPIAERVAMGGIPVELVDTAGLRGFAAEGRALDEAEAIGVERSREAMAEADLVLLVVDATSGQEQENRDLDRDSDRDPERELMQELVTACAGRGLLVARNKIDLVGEAGEGGSPASLAENALKGVTIVETSAVTGAGLDDLRAAILHTLQAGGAGSDSVVITHLRQQQALEGALAALDQADAAIASDTPHEMVLLDLYAALDQVDALTGATSTEDILQLIFGRFCIGK